MAHERRKMVRDPKASDLPGSGAKWPNGNFPQAQFVPVLVSPLATGVQRPGHGRPPAPLQNGGSGGKKVAAGKRAAQKNHCQTGPGYRL